jgi:hypothetical protein
MRAKSRWTVEEGDKHWTVNTTLANAFSITVTQNYDRAIAYG